MVWESERSNPLTLKCHRVSLDLDRSVYFRLIILLSRE